VALAYYATKKRITDLQVSPKEILVVCVRSYYNRARLLWYKSWECKKNIISRACNWRHWHPVFAHIPLYRVGDLAGVSAV